MRNVAYSALPISEEASQLASNCASNGGDGAHPGHTGEELIHRLHCDDVVELGVWRVHREDYSNDGRKCTVGVCAELCRKKAEQHKLQYMD